MTDAKKSKVELSFRSIELVERVASEDGSIPVSLSSELPVPRWDGLEILDHSPDCVDMSRAKRGLALLLDHSTREQVGRIDNLALKDGKLRGALRFSQSARGQEIRKDVLDGIRQELSVGYIVMDRRLDSEKDGECTYRVTRWMPMEGSLVAVPADETVGVGRTHPAVQEPAKPAPTPGARTMDEKETAAAIAEQRKQAIGEERTRTTQIRALGIEHQVPAEKIEDLLTSGASIDDARTRVLDFVRERLANKKLVITDDASMANMGATEKERKGYSLCRALLNAARRSEGTAVDKTFEDEVHAELAKAAERNGYTVKGLMVPLDLPIQGRAGLDSKTTTAGLELKFTEPGSFIELLRAATQVMGLGATFMPGLQGNVAFPRQTGAGSFSWVAENPGSDTSDSNLALDQVTISPKLGQSTTSYSRNLLAQAVLDVEQMVRNDLALITAIAIDIAAIAGTGASNQPKGIISQTGVGSVTLGANGGTIAWNNLVDVIKTVEAANAARGRLGWLTTPGQKAQMSKIAQISASTGIPVWFNGEVAGYKAVTSTNVPSNTTKGTSTTICHAILFGNWQELLIGQWNALDIIVDPYRLKKQGMIEVTSYVSVDVAVRHGPSFCVVPDAL